MVDPQSKLATGPMPIARPVDGLLAHAAPMLFLTSVVERGADEIVCDATIDRANPFLVGDSIDNVVLLEYMAQTVAVFAGLSAEDSAQAVQIGLLLGARGVKFYVGGVTVGDRLLVRARRVWGEQQLGQFECSVSGDHGVVAEGRLTVTQMEQEEVRRLCRSEL